MTHTSASLLAAPAWEPIAGLAPDARAPLTQVDTQRQWEWTQALPFETVGDLGDDRFVRDRRVGERRRTRRFDGIACRRCRGPGTVARPRRSRARARRSRSGQAGETPSSLSRIAEVLAPEARQRRAVDLGAPADHVVDGRTERLAAPVQVRIRRAVSLRDEDLPWDSSSRARVAGSRRARRSGPSRHGCGGRTPAFPRPCRCR